jgi:Cytochrome c
MRKSVLSISFILILLALIFFQLNCTKQQEEKSASSESRVERGKYLVDLGGCNDCHSPKVFTQNGPIPDTTKLLSGSPGPVTSLDFDPKIVAQGKWAICNGDFTAWFGPWGISYTANLTPDKETGLGNWTEERFIKALRTGKHLGEGRPILPPMPWQGLAKLKNEDLKDIFAYLQSLKPINNKVSDPETPEGLAMLPMGKK